MQHSRDYGCSYGLQIRKVITDGRLCSLAERSVHHRLRARVEVQALLPVHVKALPVPADAVLRGIKGIVPNVQRPGPTESSVKPVGSIERVAIRDILGSILCSPHDSLGHETLVHLWVVRNVRLVDPRGRRGRIRRGCLQPGGMHTKATKANKSQQAFHFRMWGAADYGQAGWSVSNGWDYSLLGRFSHLASLPGV